MTMSKQHGLEINENSWLSSNQHAFYPKKGWMNESVDFTDQSLII